MQNRQKRNSEAKEPDDFFASLADEEDLSAFSRAKREQILTAAIDLFLSAGYAATTMNGLAAKAGVTKQTIYSHFSDKESLFTAIIRRVTLTNFEAQFGQEALSGDPEDVLRRIFSVFQALGKSDQYLRLMRTIIAESARFPELARLYYRTVIQRGITLLSHYFESHPELGIKDSIATARIYCGSLIACLISQELLHGKEIMPFELERLVDPLISQILRC